MKLKLNGIRVNCIRGNVPTGAGLSSASAIYTGVKK